MRRRHTLIAASTLALLALIAPRADAQRQIGGSIGYLFDELDNYVVVSGQARFPIRDTHWSIAPRVEYYVGLSMIQGDVNLIYNIEPAVHGRLHPYVGLGAGIVHSSFDGFSDTKALLNIIFGTTIDLKNSPVQLYFESLYSSGLEYPNTEVLHGGVLVRFGTH